MTSSQASGELKIPGKAWESFLTLVIAHTEAMAPLLFTLPSHVRGCTGFSIYLHFSICSA